MKKDVLFVLVQFLLFVCYLLNWGLLEFETPQLLRHAASAGVALGIVVVILGILNLSDNLSPFPSPRKNSELIQNGIYKYVRHPIYLGILVGLYSYAIYAASLEKFLITLLLNLVFYFKSSYEEELLVQRYSSYSKYQRITGRFWPKFNSKRAQ
ncbi:isoprenylcysteine carboxylmethyltransferase family protein [Gilvibacter sp. SZ-19]|uniref:methyltransferase family protein n=1 Tax=unclassified Gilvibacter TaxID=2625242 RepID=UPI0012FADD4F|nr:isoprenylcysteine carboxylmethyltransferase family protein [Gilvibacter sp. SZ-19]